MVFVTLLVEYEQIKVKKKRIHGTHITIDNQPFYQQITVIPKQVYLIVS